MQTSKNFYKEFGWKGLAKRKANITTKKELVYLRKLLNKKQKILDLACGYGRLIIPLARQGYDIQGLDISPNFIRKAKQEAKKEGLKIRFKEGDMRELHYKKNSFDVILCMWSSFMEIAKKKDQLKSIKEMLKILNKGGFALIELPIPTIDKERWKEESKGKYFFNPKTRFIKGAFDGIDSMISYLHNTKTLKSLMKKSKIKKYKIFEDNFGGRKRFFLKFWK